MNRHGSLSPEFNCKRRGADQDLDQRLDRQQKHYPISNNAKVSMVEVVSWSSRP